MVFLHTQKMKILSQDIVVINNFVMNQSKVMIEELLEMDANSKKYTLLDKEAYRDFFKGAQREFDLSLSVVVQLISAKKIPEPDGFLKFYAEYKELSNLYTTGEKKQLKLIHWVEEDILQQWLTVLVDMRNSNQRQIEQSLGEIHDHAISSERNGLFGISLSVMIAIVGVWFVSKSIIFPLRQLTSGLKSLSKGGNAPEINVTSKDEFQDLAAAYNEMSSELREQENLRADFIATLSHEIRTPLASIQESVNLIVEEIMGTINEKQRKFLSIASLELTRINVLLDQLMHASILEVNTSKKIREPIEPEPVVMDCISSLNSLSEKKGIALKHDFQPDCGKLYGRLEDVQQILFNIVGNAIKFSPANSEITISILKDDNSEYVLFRVKDQGPGIINNEKSLIFKKYYRSKSVRKHMDGVGLGLYISHKFVKEMDGAIQVSNNRTEGCTFSIMLPKV